MNDDRFSEEVVAVYSSLSAFDHTLTSTAHPRARPITIFNMVRDVRITGILFDMDGTLVDSTVRPWLSPRQLRLTPHDSLQ